MFGFSLATNLPTLHCSSKKTSKIQHPKFECWSSSSFPTLLFFSTNAIEGKQHLMSLLQWQKKYGTTVGISTFHWCKLCEMKWQMFSCKAPLGRDWIQTDPTYLLSYWTASLVHRTDFFMFWFWLTKRNAKRLGLVCLLLSVYYYRWTWCNLSKSSYEEKQLLNKQHRMTRTYRKVQIWARFVI